MTPTRLRAESKLRQAVYGMLLATAAAYVFAFFVELLANHQRLDPLGWLANAILSPLSTLRGLFEPFLFLAPLLWFFLPAGAISGLLLPRWVASRSRSRAALQAAALGLGFALAGCAVLFLVSLVLFKSFLRHLLESGTAWRFGILILGLGAYFSLWLVGWVLWRSRVTSSVGSRPPGVPDVR